MDEIIKEMKNQMNEIFLYPENKYMKKNETYKV